MNHFPERLLIEMDFFIKRLSVNVWREKIKTVIGVGWNVGKV
jgi:hypothetical protein